MGMGTKRAGSWGASATGPSKIGVPDGALRRVLVPGGAGVPQDCMRDGCFWEEANVAHVGDTANDKPLSGAKRGPSKDRRGRSVRCRPIHIGYSR